MFKKVLRGTAFIVAIAFVVIVFDKLARTGPEKKGNLKVSADLALFGVADTLTGPGLMDRVADRMVDGGGGGSSLPDFAGQRTTAGIAPGGTIDAEEPSRRPPPPGSAAALAAGEEEGGDPAAAAERERLRRIRMLEIERGERRMYGGGSAAEGGAAASPVFRRTRANRAPSDEEIAAQLSGFVRKLKKRATDDARANPSVGDQLDEVDRLDRGEGELPVLSLDGVDNRLEQSPTLRALQQLNKDGAQSLRMSRRGGMTDGTRDKAGKRFDGNEKTMDSIPIEEVSGAFGQKSIKTQSDGGSVRDLK